MALGKINWVRWLFFSKKKFSVTKTLCSNMLGFLKGSLTKCLVFMLWP